ncbi:hypothetical protein SLS62_009080 [Diatrype stigma]|uniref:Aspartate aminotransferase n=1 Tax=Diatrype stigma TaxID=117547 RepID=A0AAN9UGV6_9PEZI
MGSSTPSSIFEHAEFIPPDAIFDVTRRFLGDSYPNKVNLGQGTYRDEKGQPWVLPSVRMAKTELGECGHEYLPIAGLKSFRDAAVKLAFKGTKAFDEERVSATIAELSEVSLTGMQIASCQSLSGTGALLLAGLALKRANAGITKVFITEPTWSNHALLFSSLGFEVKTIPYYKDGAFDFESYIAGLREADSSSAVVLHACAHNPTGCDPTREQWKDIARLVQERGIFPIFDSAYLGFNSGSVDEDAWAIRYFVEDLKLEASVCLSFAKSMGLYGERVGLVSYVTQTAATARAMSSILENVQRATISNPPAYGARIAAAVLGTPAIAEQWAKDLVAMSSRIKAMRHRLYDELFKLQTPGSWVHLIKQTGMFGYTGISPAQVAYLESE